MSPESITEEGLARLGERESREECFEILSSINGMAVVT